MHRVACTSLRFYKLGQLKQLGAKFDIRSFHDEIPSGGALPLDMLDERTDSWIKAQSSSARVATVR